MSLFVYLCTISTLAVAAAFVVKGILNIGVLQHLQHSYFLPPDYNNNSYHLCLSHLAIYFNLASRCSSVYTVCTVSHNYHTS